MRNLLKAAQSLYSKSRACVKGEWFGVDVGLTQGSMMSPRLFKYVYG